MTSGPPDSSGPREDQNEYAETWGAPTKPEDVWFSQIKEKYGTLRVYLYGADKHIDGLVTMAEACSETTCEVCGNSGSLYGTGWYYTRCLPCWTKQGGNESDRPPPADW